MDPEDRKIAALIAAFDQEHERVQRAITALGHAGEQLPREVRGAAKAAVEAALADLNPQIQKAQRALGDLQRFSVWRAAWQHLMVAIMAIAVTLLAVWWYVPSVSEMNQLRAERDQLQTKRGELQASITDLNERGGRIQLNECGDRGHEATLVRTCRCGRRGRFGDARRGKVYMIAKGY